MGIEKERELFKEEVSELDSFDLNDFTLNPFDWDEENQKFYFNPTQLMWEVWQAAKAQAVPESNALLSDAMDAVQKLGSGDFVLVSKEPSTELVNHGHDVFLGNFNEGGQTGGRSLYFAYKAMIEAQEQSHD